MPLTDPERILRQASRPRVVTLWRALQPLKSVVSFMNTGAHPDDETSEMLAALGLRDGLTLSYACANRGEGGQNDIGTEATQDLGVVRTAEMERAADALNLRMYWLSETPEDSIFDFGFSKSGQETLKKWGHKRTLTRFVEIIRTERPDIICPTFLDIPGQHGHHRAMTQLAHEVMDAAADPTFPDSGLVPWQVKKLYLPAWSGAGDAYDDDLPPPPMTLMIDAEGVDAVTGWSWAQIGQQSRMYHRTQGMGRWSPFGVSNSFPLHLARTHVDGPDVSLASGLPATLSDLAVSVGASALHSVLDEAQEACDSARSVFPDFESVAQYARAALRCVREAARSCQAASGLEVLHRLNIKDRQLCEVIRLAVGATVRAELDNDVLYPGMSVKVTLETDGEGASSDLDLPEGWAFDGNRLSLPETAEPSDPYPSQYIPGQPDGPQVVLKLEKDGLVSTTRHAFEIDPVVLPSYSVTASPAQALINLRTDRRSIAVDLTDIVPRQAQPDLDVPDGWSVDATGSGFLVVAPDRIAPGRHDVPVVLNGRPAATVRHYDYPHIAHRMRTYPARVQLNVMDAALPDVRIGYVGGGNDRVDHWLTAIGLDVVLLEEDCLTSEDLSALDTIVVGIFAMRTRPDLLAAMPLVHDWVADGGNLVTLYHRPWDAWDPDRVPPRRMEIGKPSLRWRVTDEGAHVEHLIPGHPLLNVPNTIGDADWANWHKERGLYFAKSWDNAYTPLLSMADPDEVPLEGALLTAEIGKGRHTHTSLILHHQMEKVVPGAFRLMANLVGGGRNR